MNRPCVCVTQKHSPFHSACPLRCLEVRDRVRRIRDRRTNFPRLDQAGADHPPDIHNDTKTPYLRVPLDVGCGFGDTLGVCADPNVQDREGGGVERCDEVINS